MNDHADTLREVVARYVGKTSRITDWIVRDLLAALEAGRSAEPVAWMVEFSDGSVGWTPTDEEADDAIAEAREGATKRPLYAAAPQQPPPGSEVE